MVDLLGVESHYHRTADDNHRSGHIAELFEVGESARVLCYIAFLKGYALLRKILFRLVTEHSPMLGIDDDGFRHCSPPARSVPWFSKRCVAFFAPPITSRTGCSE